MAFCTSPESRPAGTAEEVAAGPQEVLSKSRGDAELAGDIWELDLPEPGTSAKPQSSALHSEVLATVKRLSGVAQETQLQARSSGIKAVRRQGALARVEREGPESLGKAASGIGHEEWSVASEHPVGQLYCLDILLWRDRKVSDAVLLR